MSELDSAGLLHLHIHAYLDIDAYGPMKTDASAAVISVMDVLSASDMLAFAVMTCLLINQIKNGIRKRNDEQ